MLREAMYDMEMKKRAAPMPGGNQQKATHYDCLIRNPGDGSLLYIDRGQLNSPMNRRETKKGGRIAPAARKFFIWLAVQRAVALASFSRWEAQSRHREASGMISRRLG